MALRRSNRRLTVTGSSVFSASTPLVSQTGISNDADASPKWISAEEAFGNFKTPKLPKMTRRTTLTRQTISSIETVLGAAAANNEGLNPPRFFIPISPPGVKTRSRRSSLYIASSQPAKVKKIDNTVANGKKVNSKSENKIETTQKTSVKKPNEMLTDVKDQKSSLAKQTESNAGLNIKSTADGGDTTFTNISKLSPIIGSSKREVKKVRRSIRQQHLESSEMELFEESNTFAQEFQTPRTQAPQVVNQLESKPNQKIPKIKTPKVAVSATPRKSVSRSKTPRNAPKPNSLNVSPDNMDKAKVDELVGNITTPEKLASSSLSLSAGRKRLMSKEENEDIELVVKKMFSPSKFYSSKELNYKQKFISPNSGKAMSSPARSAIVKDAVNAGHRSLGRKHLESNITQRTPSRAAPKARKILGVSTLSTPVYDNAQNMQKIPIENKMRQSADETVSSSSKAEDVSFEIENESNNLTLSHTSHSQWCTIL